MKKMYPESTIILLETFVKDVIKNYVTHNLTTTTYKYVTVMIPEHVLLVYENLHHIEVDGSICVR
jgi:AAA15 family ATPase/GTPase